jgi:16S rRNA A1518/A1519 N6-dimethyltransferase RsmA/KsgA/DIM1 with predicted DNA glycosylase/AP lyase activity
MRVLVVSLALLTFGTVSATAQQFGAAENLGPRIPTPQLIVERMLEAAHVTAEDLVYDLGSGDGRIVVTAVQKFGARAVGVEIMPDLCKQARDRIQSLGLTERARIIEGSALRVDLTPATVITMFFMTNSNERLKPALLKLHRGTRVVSNQFPIGGWKAAQVVHLKTGKMENSIFVYEIGRTN